MQMIIHHQLANDVAQAIVAAQKASTLPDFEPPEVTIERPRETSFGDYACPTPLKLARVARMAPLKIAQAIAAHIPATNYTGEVTVAPPGFINIRLATPWVQQVVNEMIEQGGNYGRLQLGKGQKTQIECVSANPTGPIHMGRIRGGVMGDTLARAYKMADYDAIMEYYYNDAGRQITLLGESTKIRYQQLLGQKA
jgi:arginyl-tRNA synthetase